MLVFNRQLRIFVSIKCRAIQEKESVFEWCIQLPSLMYLVSLFSSGWGNLTPSTVKLAIIVCCFVFLLFWMAVVSFFFFFIISLYIYEPFNVALVVSIFNFFIFIYCRIQGNGCHLLSNNIYNNLYIYEHGKVCTRRMWALLKGRFQVLVFFSFNFFYCVSTQCEANQKWWHDIVWKHTSERYFTLWQAHTYAIVRYIHTIYYE